VSTNTFQSQSILVFHDAPQPGPENMAMDERLLAAALPHWPIVIRIYRWSEPTLSLGHFQSPRDLEQDPSVSASPSLLDLPQVRRKTGGGAILHDRELTYSFVVPAGKGSFDKGHSEILYRAVHESIRDGLTGMGIPASLSQDCTCGAKKLDTKEPFLCFLRRTPVDLVMGEHKILGSAQRRTRSGLLQHGSLLLRAAPAFPTLPGVEDLASNGAFCGESLGRNATDPAQSKETVAWEGWQDFLSGRIAAGVRNALGWECEELMLKSQGNSLKLMDWIGSLSHPNATPTESWLGRSHCLSRDARGMKT